MAFIRGTVGPEGFSFCRSCFVMEEHGIFFMMDGGAAVCVLQNTLLMVNSKGNNAKMLPLTAATSAVVLIVILFLSVFVLADAVRRIRREEAGPTLGTS